MSDLDHIGDGTEWDLLVQRIREMPDETRDHELVMQKAAAFDEGWRKACEYLESDLRANKREFGRRIEDRVWREARRWQRAFLFNFITVTALLLVMGTAISYLTEVN